MVLGKVECKHGVSLGIDERVRSVDILGLGVIQHPAAETDHIAAQVDDRGDETVAEIIIVMGAAVPLALFDQIGLIKLLWGKALFPHVDKQGIPAVRRIAEAEVDDRIPRQAPVFQVLQRMRPLRGEQRPVEKTCRLPVGLIHPAALPAERIVIAVLGQVHARLLGKQLDRFHIVQIVD